LLPTQEVARDDAAAAEAQDDGVPQLFSFLNRAVGDGSEAAAVRRRSSGEDKSAFWAPAGLASQVIHREESTILMGRHNIRKYLQSLTAT